MTNTMAQVLNYIVNEIVKGVLVKKKMTITITVNIKNKIYKYNLAARLHT